MKNTNINEKTRTGNTQVKTGENTQVNTAATGTLYAFGGLGALVGIWGIACFIGGLVSAGGPLAFLKAWFTAVSGM